MHIPNYNRGLDRDIKRRLERRNYVRVLLKILKNLITFKAIKANGRPPEGCAVHFRPF